MWSPNGETLAFFASDGGLASPWLKIVLANRAGHVIGDLLQGTHSRISWLDWSPDGKRIAYSCGNGQTPQDWEVCIIDVKTHAHHVLTRPSKNPDGTLDQGSASLIHVSWSPNGQDIAFDGRHDVTCPVIPGIPPDPTIQCTQSDIYRANVHTGAVTELTDSNDLMAQYSPDGHELVFTHIHFFGTNTSPTGIYIASASGAHPRLLVSADHMLHGGYPAWSPDGKQIVYSSASDGANDGNTDLFTVNAVGHLARTRVTDTPDDNNEASWTAAITTCTVPRLTGKTLSAAKALIKRAGCKVGKVTGPKSKHVIGQNPAPNRDVPTGTHVNVRLG